MSSRSTYDSIHEKCIADIESNNIKVDGYLSGRRIDSRMGISLIVPIRSISSSYVGLASIVKGMEPEQYYYPPEDLHITIFDFIQGTEDYVEDAELGKTFFRISMEAIASFSEFSIAFKGIVFSDAAGMLQGYDEGVLIKIRKNIRALLKENGIKNDERYESESAHATFMRFADKLRHPETFRVFIERNRDLEIGVQKIDAIELVEHDWYNRASRKRVIGRISI